MPTLRRADAADAVALAALLRAAFAPYEAAYTPVAFAATCPPAAALAARLAEGPTWLAVEGGALVGTVSARAEEGALYVRSMAVAPHARGRGVGRVLLTEVEAYARERGATRLRLSTTPFLLEAIRLYAGAGFLRVPDEDSDLHGTPLLGMEKRLAWNLPRKV